MGKMEKRQNSTEDCWYKSDRAEFVEVEVKRGELNIKRQIQSETLIRLGNKEKDWKRVGGKRNRNNNSCLSTVCDVNRDQI